MEKEIRLEDLVGNHILSGVSMVDEIEVEIKNNKYYSKGYKYAANSINFVLDGITYTAIEDDNDGWRSMMAEIFVSDVKLTNMFVGQEVIGAMREHSDYEKNNVLDLIDCHTGKIVLSVGTENYDDYYPYCVMKFNPENMYINAEVEDNEKMSNG